MSINKKFTRYVSQNVFGMIGISLYILADTFFISKVEGANGITALNLVLPVYNLIFAIGAMIGVGSAIRFAVLRARGDKHAEDYFSSAIIWAGMLGAVLIVLGVCFPGQIVGLLGGDAEIRAVGTSYTRIFMLFTPCFMWNSICNAFVRNDGAPTIAMAATLCSSLFNIVMDYILMFPLKMGMSGAALATAVSPIIGILICCIHFASKRNSIHFHWQIPSLKRLISACQLGIAAFIGELSSGVTTIVFNLLILHLAGNIGVAAYGVIANTSLVAIAVFNGVSQGGQPLISKLYGKNDKKNMSHVLKMSLITSAVMAVGMIIATNVWASQIVGIFNSEQNLQMAAYAENGLKLYFIGFLFAGINIVGSGYLSAVESAKWAFSVSISRGVVAIIACAVILAQFFGLDGVWLSFPAAESVTAVITCTAIYKNYKY